MSTSTTRAASYEVVQGDALAVLSAIPDGAFDGVVCDPPYGTTQAPWDSVIPLAAMWEELRRVVKPGGTFVFMAAQPFSAALIMSNPKWFRHDLVWEKNKATGHLNAKRRPMRAHEDILVFCESSPRYSPQMSEGHAPVNSFTRRSNGELYGATKVQKGGGSTARYPRSVVRFSVVNNSSPEKFHPNQKPVELAEYLVKTYAAPGMRILDFACGSGSFGVGALRCGVDYFGIDISQSYCDRARARLRAVSLEAQA
ncbi:DNA-methyltransferase [Pseudomonas shirazica]|uniref:DNA-methyltransferase n=1 Tax=Pseudomonas shirazica TaxID=1940636 RepID=UPI003AABF5B7